MNRQSVASSTIFIIICDKKREGNITIKTTILLYFNCHEHHISSDSIPFSMVVIPSMRKSYSTDIWIYIKRCRRSSNVSIIDLPWPLRKIYMNSCILLYAEDVYTLTTDVKQIHHQTIFFEFFFPAEPSTN